MKLGLTQEPEADDTSQPRAPLMSRDVTTVKVELGTKMNRYQMIDLLLNYMINKLNKI